MSASKFPESYPDWYRRVFLLAWPIVLSNLSVPLVGVVDTAVTGRLSDPIYMGAVAIGATIFSSVFWVFGFLRMGTTGFVSQAYGRNESRSIAIAFIRALSIAFILGILLVLLQVPIAWVAFNLMGAPNDISEAASRYFSIRVWSAPATFINYCVLGCLIGMQRTRSALLIQLILNLTNVTLDILFVMQFGMDSDGVALASVISEYTAAMFGLWILRNVILIALRENRNLLHDLIKANELRALFEVNANLFVRTLLITGGFFFFTSQSAQFGAVVLAANAVLMNMLMMLSYGLDGFAHAVEALVGGAYGARDKNAFKKAVVSSSVMAGVTALFISVIYLFFGETIIQLMTNIEGVISVAMEYLPWLIAAPLLSVWSYQFDGIYVGAIKTKIMRNTVGISLLLFIALVIVSVPMGGNHALWGSLMLFLLARGVLLFWKFPLLLAEFKS